MTAATRIPRLYGEARQNGFVVEDLDTAVMKWAQRLGAGPFFVVRHVSFEYFRYCGQPSEPDISIAVGFMGDLQIELIHQHNAEPSPYLDFARAKGSGLHHISGWSAEFDADLARLLEANLAPDCEGRVAGMSRFAYWHTSEVDGTAYELSDLGAGNEIGAVHELIHQASVDWDGSEPLRVFG